MKKPILAADIIPGLSAGGFTLGQKLTEFDSGTLMKKRWKSEDGSLIDAIYSTDDFFVADLEDFTDEKGVRIYFSRGALGLHFSAAGTLFHIAVFSGYTGSFLNRFGIGTPASEVQEMFELSFDDGDEMHYPQKSSGLEGIAFHIDDGSDDGLVPPCICGISIYNWTMQ